MVTAFTYFGDFIRKRIIERFRKPKPGDETVANKRNFLNAMAWQVLHFNTGNFNSHWRNHPGGKYKS